MQDSALARFLGFETKLSMNAGKLVVPPAVREMVYTTNQHRSQAAVLLKV